MNSDVRKTFHKYNFLLMHVEQKVYPFDLLQNDYYYYYSGHAKVFSAINFLSAPYSLMHNFHSNQIIKDLNLSFE